MLALEEKRQLLADARAAIADAFAGRAGPSPTAGHGALLEPRGAFVTLRIDGELRGCIGFIEATRPLSEVVCEMARRAAFDDPRFPPLTAAEFDRISVEVSILSPLHRITSMDEIVVGVHGLMLELGPNRGLLLPQVAAEYGWDRETFLGAVSRKAGLSTDAWRHPEAVIYTFTAEVVQESDVTA
jgi:AmmeMemoRadiSam system protein A